MNVTADQGFELRGGGSTSLREMVRQLWNSRDLLRMLARKSFAVRYRRASAGMLWAVIMPLVQATMLAVIFTKIVPIPVEGRNRGVFIYAAVLPWSFFSSTIGAAASAIVDGKDVSTRVYFPRAIFPLVVVRANLYGFLPGLIVLLAIALAVRVPLGVDLLLLVPGFVLLALLSAGFALVLAAAHVYFRDVRHLVAAALIPWFYATGVFFPLSLAKGWLGTVLKANPMVGVVQLFRAATVGADPGWAVALWWSVGWCIVLFVAAALLYRRFDRVFVDLM